MSFSRYSGRSFFLNDDRGYQKELFDRRDVKQIMQYETARFYYPNFAERMSIDTVSYVWTATSKLYNLASEFYGAPELWWLIAWYNKKPTETHFKTGDVIDIPADLHQVMGYFVRQQEIV